DGIRDPLVTGVQTCALPIWPPAAQPPHAVRTTPAPTAAATHPRVPALEERALERRLAAAEAELDAFRRSPLKGLRDWGRQQLRRSEERRVGKEGTLRRAG